MLFDIINKIKDLIKESDATKRCFVSVYRMMMMCLLKEKLKKKEIKKKKKRL